MFLKIKKIPKVKWSSEKPFNFKPKFSTFFFLCFGLSLFGLGEGLLIVSFTGASPWSVLAQGISLNVNLSIGTITLLISIAVLILWIPLGQKPGMGTIIMVGIGGGIYLVSNLGAGPRDGLMIGLQKLTNFPIAVVRATLEISVVSIGWYLGGTVGIGTLLFAFGIGPCVALGLYLVDKTFD